MHIIGEDIKGANKDAKVLMLEGLLPCTIFCFVLHSCTICMNCITETFLSVSSSVRIKQLIVFRALSRPKKQKKDIQQISLLGFIAIPLALLTIIKSTNFTGTVKIFTDIYNVLFLQDFLTQLFKFNKIKDFYETLEVSLCSISCHGDLVTVLYFIYLQEVLILFLPLPFN